MNTIQQLAEEYGVTYVEVIDGTMLDPGLILSLPVTWAREQYVLPIRLNGVASLLMPGPESMPALQHASLVTGEDLQPAFAHRDVLLSAIGRAYYEGKSTEAPAPSADEISAAELSDAQHIGHSSGNDLLIDQQAQPVTQYLNNVLLEAVRKDASDVHLEPIFGETMRVRFRLDGILYEQSPPPRGFARPMVSRVKVMAGMDIAERRLPQDGMAQVRVGDRIVDLRISTVPVGEGERVVLRLLNRERSLVSMAALGMPDSVYAGLKDMIDRPNGLIVVSGPTGSGKTTTLYAALGTLDASRRNVLTIEDPVEYRLPNIGQIQVKPKIGLTFASGLRHILRQDPDVVLVGEIRDSETAEIAVRASLTGHLVFTTLHTNDAASAVMRLVDMGVEPYLLASCLRGVIAQRLVRQVCPQCAEAFRSDAPELSTLERNIARSAGCTVVKRAVGCPKCLEGYTGRQGIFEFLPCGPAVEAAIHKGNLSADELRAIAEPDPAYCSLAMDAATKLCAGITTPAEIAAAIGGTPVAPEAPQVASDSSK